MQQQAVARIRSVYGRVYYDFHEVRPPALDPARQSGVPAFLQRVFGQDTFHNVVGVDLDSPMVTDDTIAAIAYLPGLRRVYIGQSSVTKEGLKRLQSVPLLQRLYVEGPTVDDEFISLLSDFHDLEVLELQRTCITDKGLSALRLNSRLRRLVVDSTAVSAQGISDLRNALPNCVIIF